MISHLDFKAINNDIACASYIHLKRWLPNGRWEAVEYKATNPTKRDNNIGSFSVNKNGKWADFAIGDKGGDFISLYSYLHKITYYQAALALTQQSDFSPMPHSKHSKVPKVNAPKTTDQARLDFVNKLLNSAVVIKDSLGDKYLQSRGITIDLPSDLKFSSSHRYVATQQNYPALLASARCSNTNKVTALHRTYLRHDGLGKANISSPKMMLRSLNGGLVQLCPPATRMAVGEGLETCLSYMQLTGVATWSALTSGNLSKAILPSLAREIIIVTDNDSAGKKAARKLAERLDIEGRSVRIAMSPPQ